MSKSRAKTLDAYYILMFEEEATTNILSHLKLYKTINHVRMELKFNILSYQNSYAIK